MIPRRRFCEVVALAALGLGVAGYTIENFYARQLTPLLALLCLGIFILCVVFRLFIAGAAWALAALVGLSAIVPAFLPRDAAPRPGCSISVVTFNKLTYPAELVNDVGAARLLASLNPDVALVLRIDDITSFQSNLRANGFASYNSFASPSGSELILSRFPLVRSKYDAVGVSADILVEGREVSLRSMYSTRPNRDWAGYIAYHQRLREEVNHYDGPLILAGDANATAFTPEITALRAILKDAWDEAGFGFGFTWPASYRRLGMFGPWLRIDYIFHNAAFDAVTARRIDDATGAGHFPVFAILTFVGVGNPGAPCR